MSGAGVGDAMTSTPSISGDRSPGMWSADPAGSPRFEALLRQLRDTSTDRDAVRQAFRRCTSRTPKPRSITSTQFCGTSARSTNTKRTTARRSMPRATRPCWPSLSSAGPTPRRSTTRWRSSRSGQPPPDRRRIDGPQSGPRRGVRQGQSRTRTGVRRGARRPDRRRLRTDGQCAGIVARAEREGILPAEDDE